MNTDAGVPRGIAPPASCQSRISDYTRSPPMHVEKNTPRQSECATAGTQTGNSDSNFLRVEMWRCDCGGPKQEIKHEKPMENQEDLSVKLLRASEENIRLRSVIHDVKEVNKRWQKYNLERTGYVQKLLSTIKELQQKEVSSSESSGRSLDVTSHVGRCENLRVENLILQKQLEDCEKRCELANDAVKKTRQEMAERIELLEMQVKLQAEDFVSERREKKEAKRLAEKCKEEYEQLNNKIRDMDNDKGQYKVYVCTCKKNFENDGIFCKVAEYQRRHRSTHSSNIQVLPCQLIPRTSSVPGLTFRGSFEESLSQRDSAVSLGSPLSSPPNSAESGLESQISDTQTNKWFLVCPKCRKHFPPNLGVQFRSHLDKCEEAMLHRTH